MTSPQQSLAAALNGIAHSDGTISTRHGVINMSIQGRAKFRPYGGFVVWDLGAGWGDVAGVVAAYAVVVGEAVA